MARDEYRVSEASRPVLERYATLPRNDPRRVELFTFLAAIVEDPRSVRFEPDAEGLRWTWLEHVAIVWKLDLVAVEIDVVYAWDETAD